MIRKIGVALFGIIIAVALIYVIEMIGHNIYPDNESGQYCQYKL